jgi:hypothetical protein
LQLNPCAFEEVVPEVSILAELEGLSQLSLSLIQEPIVLSVILINTKPLPLELGLGGFREPRILATLVSDF